MDKFNNDNQQPAEGAAPKPFAPVSIDLTADDTPSTQPRTAKHYRIDKNGNRTHIPEAGSTQQDRINRVTGAKKYDWMKPTAVKRPHEDEAGPMDGAAPTPSRPAKRQRKTANSRPSQADNTPSRPAKATKAKKAAPKSATTVNQMRAPSPTVESTPEARATTISSTGSDQELARTQAKMAAQMQRWDGHARVAAEKAEKERLEAKRAAEARREAERIAFEKKRAEMNAREEEKAKEREEREKLEAEEFVRNLEAGLEEEAERERMVDLFGEEPAEEPPEYSEATAEVHDSTISGNDATIVNMGYPSPIDSAHEAKEGEKGKEMEESEEESEEEDDGEDDDDEEEESPERQQLRQEIAVLEEDLAGLQRALTWQRNALLRARLPAQIEEIEKALEEKRKALEACD